MKVVSFNVNSVRQRPHQLKALIERHQPEIIGLQETKVQDVDFPIQDMKDLGYHVEFHGQKTHYGVAILSKTAPTFVQKGFAGEAEDAQRRFILGKYETSLGEITVANGYFPQGESRDHETKFPNKRDFYSNLTQLLQNDYSPDQPVIVMGDMNISPTDDDIGIGEDNRKRWLRTGKCSFLPEEREWLTTLQNWGLEDTFRKHFPEASDLFSWFDYRSRGFEREPRRGLRIDLVLATQMLNERCIAAGIDYDIRGMEKPSDHCPVWAEFA